MLEGRDAHPLVHAIQRRDELTAEEQAAIEGLPWRIRTFAANEEFIREGSTPHESCLLVEGFCIRSKSFRDGQIAVTSVHVPGDFVDLHSLILKVVDHSVSALTPCKAAFIGHDALREVTQTSPHLARLLWTMTEIDGAIQRVWNATLSRLSSTQRLAHLLCEVFSRLEVVGLTTGMSIVFPINQTIIGDRLGLSTVHSNRTIQQLRATGWVSWRKPIITINDWAALAHLAQFDPTYLNLKREKR